MFIKIKMFIIIIIEKLDSYLSLHLCIKFLAPFIIKAIAISLNCQFFKVK